jgi:hypothetical protein
MLKQVQYDGGADLPLDALAIHGWDVEIPNCANAAGFGTKYLT